MGYAVLKPHIRQAELGALTVLLDLKRNTYSALSTAALASALTDDEAGRVLRTRLAAAEVLDEPVSDPGELRWAHARFWPALVWAGAQVRRGRLDLSFRALARCKLAAGGGRDRIAPALAFYWTWRPWYPARMVCLFDSLALMRFLLVSGAPSDIDLVLGVRGMPFEAHCWIERAGVILNDEDEYCRSFTEIARV